VSHLPPKLQIPVRQLERELRNLYGPRFRGLLLYGSYARGEADEGSDIDLLLLLSGPVDPVQEILRLGPLKWPLALAHDIVLSVVPVSQEAFQTSPDLFLSTVRQDAVAVA
jgi:predicted nucleotidyltransferase